MTYLPSRASRIVRNFVCASASSFDGVDPATIPQPANIRRVLASSGFDLGAAQGDAEGAVTARVDPPDRTCVPAPVHALELTDQRPRLARRGAAAPQRWGAGLAAKLESGLAVGEPSGHISLQVLDVREAHYLRGSGNHHVGAEGTQRVGH